LSEPVEDALESMLGIRRVSLEALAILVLDIVVGDIAPAILAIVEVPLVEQGNSAVTGQLAPK
jgi:hypothetical protein